MKHFAPFPPLAEIENRLFGVTDGLIEAVKAGQTSDRIARSVRQTKEWAAYGKRKDVAEGISDTRAVAAAIPPMPHRLKELIARRAATSQASFAALPASGQIVEIRQIITPRPQQLDWVMQVPLYVLLDAEAESRQLWHGWLVSNETDYASTWDFVLQEQDEPFDPEVGMVQVWNPVRLYLPMAGRIMAQLRLERLQAIRALAAEFLQSGDGEHHGRPMPGRVAVRTTLDGLKVATGTPLDGASDPRRRYQLLYFHAAEAIREPARLALAVLSPSQNPVVRLLGEWMGVARGLGEALQLVPRIEVPMRKEPKAASSMLGTRTLGSKEQEEPDTGLACLSRSTPFDLDWVFSEDVPASLVEPSLPAEDSSPIKSLAPTPQEYNEEVEAEESDLVWRHDVRIRILDLRPEGGGCLMILPGTDTVRTFIRAGAIMSDQATVTPGGEPAALTWEDAQQIVLTLESADGHKLELPLASTP